MEQYVLYLVLKDIVSKLDNSFKYSFDDMDSNEGNVVGIYVRGGEPSQYRTLEKGVYYNVNNRVQFLIQGDLSNDSLMNCLKLGTKIKKTLSTTSNVYYTASSKVGLNVDGDIELQDGTKSLTDITVIMCKVDMIGDLVPIGKNEQGKPRYSINFKIQYELGGN